MDDLGIVIVNWNTRDLLRECLRTVYASTGDFRYRVVVVDNASPDGSTSAAPEVSVSVSDDVDTVTFAVSDNGPGLAPRARANLFVAFEGSARAGGTGLGLAIAREITEAHGGRLVLADQPVGTRFELTFPASLRVRP